MSESPRRDLLLAALAYAVLSVVLFGGSFASDRLFVPMHTERLQPWRAELTPDRAAELSAGENAAMSDTLISFRADDAITIEAMRDGELPLWNPTNAGGVPHLAQALYGVFYPFHLIYRWLDPERAYGFLAALHHFLAALFTFLFLRRIGAGSIGAFLGGLAYGFSMYFMMRAHYYQYAANYAWLPLGLLLVEQWFDRRSLVTLSGLALLTGLVLLASWPQHAVYIIYAWLLLAVCRSVGPDLRVSVIKVVGAVLVVLAGSLALGKFIFTGSTGHGNLSMIAPWVGLLIIFFVSDGKGPFLRRMAWVCAAFFVGGLIASIQYLPALEWIPFGNRSGIGTPELNVQLGLRPAFLLDGLFPGLFGNPDFPYLEHNFNLPRMFAYMPSGATGAEAQSAVLYCIQNNLGNLVENALFVGLVTPFLALIGLLLRSARRGFLLLLLVVYGGFATGIYWIVNPVWFGGFFVGAAPRRALAVMLFAVCCLAGLGLGAMLRGRGRLLTSMLATFLLLVAAGSLWLGFTGSDDQILRPFTDNAARVAAAFEIPDTIPPEAIESNARLVRDCLLRFGLFGLLSAAAMFLVATGLRTWLRQGAVIAVLAADLIVVGWPLTRPLPADGFLGEHPVITHLQADVGKSGRIAHYFDGEKNLLKVAVPPNLAGCYGLYDSMFYTVSPPRRWVALAERIDPELQFAVGTHIRQFSTPKHLASPVLDLMAIRAIVGFGDKPESLPEGIVDEGDFGSSWVLRNEQAYPRAFTVAAALDGSAHEVPALLDRLLSVDFDPRQTVILEGKDVPDGGGFDTAALPLAIISEDERERVVVRLEGGSGGGFLVLLDSYAPGWVATVDGQEVPVYIADVAFRAVPFPAGASEIVLTYDPPSVYIGRIISLAGLVLAILGLLIGLLRAGFGKSRKNELSPSTPTAPES